MIGAFGIGALIGATGLFIWDREKLPYSGGVILGVLACFLDSLK